MRVALRALANLARLLVAPVWLLGRWLARPKATWVVLRLSPRLTQFRPRSTFVQRLLTRAPELRASSLEELCDLVDAMAGDARIHGLLLYVPAMEAGWARCQSVRALLGKLREAGKQIVCYLPEGGGNRELFLALAADRIYTAPFSAFGPLGIASNPLYVRALLDRMGLDVEVQSCGEYKSAAEPALRDTMSGPAREQLEQLLATIQGELAGALRERRGLSVERVTALFERGLVGAAEAVASGIVDGVAYEDELAQRLGLAPEEDAAARTSKQKAEAARQLMLAAPYVRIRTARLLKPVRERAHVAVVPLHGAIAGGRGALLRSGIRPEPVGALLRALGKQRTVAAVVLHIDSPGGSALASELIHREVTRLARKKPVVAYFGDVAASGGYYIGCGCARIVAQPLTITGSIGVVSAKLAAGRLLDRLGARPQRIAMSPSADMLSVTRALSANEHSILQAHANELYVRFVEVVAEGRKRPASEIEPLARGRVWTGTAAQERGLVDRLGGIEAAFDEARSLATAVCQPMRAALRPRVYTVKAGSQRLPDIGLAALANWVGELSELELLYACRRELALYYEPAVAQINS